MSAKITKTDVLNAKELILKGVTMKVACETIGFNQSTVKIEFKKIGFDYFSKPKVYNQIDLPKDELLAKYKRGESINSIAKFFNVSRGVINRNLIEYGVTPRTQSESEKLKWSKMSEKARINQVAKAHIASKGRVRTESEMIASAKTREMSPNKIHIGDGEIELFELLNNRGINAIHQKAVGRYNVDITIGNVAVELTICRSRFTAHNSSFNKRVKYLLERGFKTICIVFDSVDTIIRDADNIIGNLQILSEYPPSFSHYWVIRSRLNNTTVVHSDNGKFTAIPSSEKIITHCKMVEM